METKRPRAVEELSYRIAMRVQQSICPRCGVKLMQDQQAFCADCGQKLSWEDEQ